MEQARRNGSASILNEQLEGHLERLSAVLQPFADEVDKKFVRRLRDLGYPKTQIHGLSLITSGAAARTYQAGGRGLQFFESVSRAGKWLAKLNLPPSEVMRALQEYDHLLQPYLETLATEALAGFHWVREQLQFCVILALNEAYYHVRETETQKAIAAAEQIVAKAREAAAQERAQMLAQLKREVGQLVVKTTATGTGKVLN